MQRRKMKKSQPNGKSLVIVESPAKAKTINRYLGSDFIVKASMGHVRDLPSRSLGIDLQNDFAPTYEIVLGRKKIVSELAKAAEKTSAVYLATDLDREGEAIAWHLMEALELDKSRVKRVVFNEITKSAITAAFKAPRDIDMDKVNAQQARRTLDRIVGYQLSPLLWRKIAKGLSAGRVQSVAVRLIVEREWEIRAFAPEESWRISAVFTPDAASRHALAKRWTAFLAKGEGPDGGRTQKERIEWLSENGCLAAEVVRLDGLPFKPTSHEAALRLAEHLGFVCEKIDQQDWSEYAAQNLKKIELIGMTSPSPKCEFKVTDVQSRQTSSKPPPPFTTASLQQAASTQLSFSASRTMRVAQGLYEGIDIGSGDGTVGLITYMRTDSTVLSKDSVAAIRELITTEYGQKYLPSKPRTFAQSKRAQEAHEAVRPTDVKLTPASLKDRLPKEQWRLYDLIWRRAVACQMEAAEWLSTTMLISAATADGTAEFKATGRQLVFDGYQKVAGVRSSGDLILPKLDVGTALAAMEIDPEQQFTSPPPRYTEASLVKSMESEGIGRPSTYAAIIQTIQDRGYVEQVDRKFRSTDKGEIVTEKLIEHFPNIMNVKFTSFMEEELDKIEEAHLDWVSVLREFYEPFQAALATASSEMTPARSEPSEFRCPKCDLEMVYRWAKTGRFLSCTGYPECDGAYNVDSKGQPIKPVKSDIKCDKCGNEMVMRQSRHGFFLGCAGYPECSNIVPCNERGEPHALVKEESLEKPCEVCGQGTMKVKRSGFRSFLGCDQYPKCKNTTPLPEGVRLERKERPVIEAGFPCDRCGRPMHVKAGRRGEFIACSGFPKCRNTYPIEKLDDLQKMSAEGKLNAPPPPADTNGNGSAGKSPKKAARRPITKTSAGKIDLEAMGPPPPGFAWTRTGRPVVETMPEDDLKCPECGHDMLLKSGRFGPFFSCTNFPKCKCSVNLRGEAKKQAEKEMPAPVRPKPIPTEVICDECGSKMVIRTSRNGPFLGCSAFPKCKTTKPLPDELAPLAATAAQ